MAHTLSPCGKCHIWHCSACGCPSGIFFRPEEDRATADGPPAGPEVTPITGRPEQYITCGSDGSSP